MILTPDLQRAARAATASAPWLAVLPPMPEPAIARPESLNFSEKVDATVEFP